MDKHCLHAAACCVNHLLLNRGYGLLTVALITVILPILAAVVRGVIAFRSLVVPFGFHYVDRAFFREMANYSGVTFIIIVAGRLRFKTDEIVIGTFLSAVAITYFNIGARIVDYAGDLVTSLAQIFVPISSQSEAIGRYRPAAQDFCCRQPLLRLPGFPHHRRADHSGEVCH